MLGLRLNKVKERNLGCRIAFYCGILYGASSKEGGDDSVERGWNARMICVIG